MENTFNFGCGVKAEHPAVWSNFLCRIACMFVTFIHRISWILSDSLLLCSGDAARDTEQEISWEGLLEDGLALQSSPVRYNPAAYLHPTKSGSLHMW